MGLHVRITDLGAFDGEYGLDETQGFTGHELHLIKQVSGLRLGELDDGIRAKDYDLLVALTAIMCIRSGKATRQQQAELLDAMLAAQVGSIFFWSDKEAAASPPAEAPASGAANDNSPPSSKDLKPTGDDPPVIPLRATGTQP